MIEWAANTFAATVEDMGINHGRAYIGVSKQLLNRPNVVAVLEQVGRERMSQRMAAAGLADAGALNCPLYRPLQAVLGNVVAPDSTRARVFRALLSRED